MRLNKTFLLIGKPIKHSFSKDYFTKKFQEQNLEGYQYKLQELDNITQIASTIKHYSSLCGFNVTSPYKKAIIPYLNGLSDEANTIQAVNCVKVKNKELIGYNTDVFGFRQSLINQTDISNIHSAIILGTGGAAQAVGYALKMLNIKHIFVSRNTPNKSKDVISYEMLNKQKDFSNFNLIINATPCGLSKGNPIADINIKKIISENIVYDLIYNPLETKLLQLSKNQGAKTINGLQMFYFQAEQSWRIWQNE